LLSGRAKKNSPNPRIIKGMEYGRGSSKRIMPIGIRKNKALLKENFGILFKKMIGRERITRATPKPKNRNPFAKSIFWKTGKRVYQLMERRIRPTQKQKLLTVLKGLII
jgi:hypothetical protein